MPDLRLAAAGGSIDPNRFLVGSGGISQNELGSELPRWSLIALA